jgi:hypothetical protein
VQSCDGSCYNFITFYCFQIAEAHPALLHLITQENRPPLTLKMLTHLLKPQFSATGSNLRVTESTVYQKFVKYTREVAGNLTFKRYFTYLGISVTVKMLNSQLFY